MMKGPVAGVPSEEVYFPSGTSKNPFDRGTFTELTPSNRTAETRKNKGASMRMMIDDVLWVGYPGSG
jgi:hypothetical protein